MCQYKLIMSCQCKYIVPVMECIHNKARQSLGDDVEALFGRQVFRKIRFQMIDDIAAIGLPDFLSNSWVNASWYFDDCRVSTVGLG